MVMHKKTCECRLCQLKETMSDDEAISAFQRQQMEMLAKYGWFAHYVSDDPDAPMGVNFHTHGMDETFDHPDLQIVFPIDPKIAHSLFWEAINQIKSGKKFRDGDVVDKIVGNGFSVKFVEAQENERTVLRMILPDKYGNLDRADLAGTMAEQYGV